MPRQQDSIHGLPTSKRICSIQTLTWLSNFNTLGQNPDKIERIANDTIPSCFPFLIDKQKKRAVSRAGEVGFGVGVGARVQKVVLGLAALHAAQEKPEGHGVHRADGGGQLGRAVNAVKRKRGLAHLSAPNSPRCRKRSRTPNETMSADANLLRRGSVFAWWTEAM